MAKRVNDRDDHALEHEQTLQEPQKPQLSDLAGAEDILEPGASITKANIEGTSAAAVQAAAAEAQASAAVGVPDTPQGKSAAMMASMNAGEETQTSLDKTLVPITWPVSPAYQTMLNHLPTKSAKIRRMSADGYTRSQISKHLGILYQHVRNVLTSIVKRPLGTEMPNSLVARMTTEIERNRDAALRVQHTTPAEDPEAIDETRHADAA